MEMEVDIIFIPFVCNIHQLCW